MSDIISLGLWIKRRRKALDLTQAALAQRVGCSLDLIQKIEGDARRPSREMAARLADMLDLATDERAPFIQAARAELGADRLPPPAQSVAYGAFIGVSPAPAYPPTPTATSTAPLPSGTVTFLFTDIEGSTRLWEEHLQAMPAVIERHNALLHQVVAAHGGVVFKTVGDSILAVFAGAPSALAAALAAQRVLLAEAWDAVGALRVRMALHTGSAAARDGDYLGLPLNRVARLLAAGHGGQILLSLATQELLRDQLPDDTALRDLGVHRLKDLARPEAIFQVVAPDLPSDFPPLHTPGIWRANLPTSPTPLIGREHELAQLGALLHQPATRLLTLTGPGGIGKTRLALDLAGAVLGEFPDGVWLIELAALADPALIVPTIAAVLGLREDPGRLLLTTLTTYVRERQLLLILDNCEHVIDACAQVATTLLQACPRLRLLASSREPLGVAGEAFFRVPALTAPDPHRLPPLEQLGLYKAVQLFVARANVVQPAFEVTAATAAPLAQICARLDGIPLAIELAAARTRVLTVEQIAARLDDRFRLLTGGSRTALPRHQTLQALIDWSYELLSDVERTLLRRLAVFAGGWTLEAAEAVCEFKIENEELRKAKDDREILNSQVSILDDLTHLVDKSLVQVDQVGNAARYRMLETIRQYALEKLAASGEADTVRRRHAHYYLQLAEQRGEVAGGWAEHMAEWTDHTARLETEHDNLRVALAWSQAPGGAKFGLRLVLELTNYWLNHGHQSEARGWMTNTLAHPEAQERTRFRAEVLEWLARMHGSFNDYAAAQATLAECLAIYQDLEDANGYADVLERLGWLAREQGDTITASIRLQESLELKRKLGDSWGIVVGLNTLGELAVMQGDERWAAELLEESLALARPFDHPYASAWALNHLGHLAQIQADYNRAKQLHMESLSLFRQFSEQHNGTAWALHGLGESALAQNDLSPAREWLAASLTQFRNLSDRSGVSWCLAGLGSAAALDEEPERAARLWGAAERLRAALGCRTAPAARVTYERAMVLARAQLGDQAFAAAWAAGATLSLDQAIAEALGET